MRRNITPLFIVTSLALAFQQHSFAQNAEALEEVLVIGITPDGNAQQNLNHVPFAVHSATYAALEASQALDLSEYMNAQMGSVTINSAQNNPLQADLQYRGFTASPLLGLPQGLSVYQNGVRINEPLGDAVNWDLLPESAIYRVDLMGGANPVFGLNTLGGALALQMKDGFNFTQHSITASTGSWGRNTTTLESGANNGEWGYYANLSVFDEDGWRAQSNSEAVNFYGTANWRPNEDTSYDAVYQQGQSDLIGNGALPVGLVQLQRDAVFTAPDVTENDMSMMALSANYSLSPQLTISFNAYQRKNTTDSFNGDSSEFEQCEFFGGQLALFEESDDVEDALEDELGIELDAICSGQNSEITHFAALEDLIAQRSNSAGVDPSDYDIENIFDDLSGSGIIADDAINNISQRKQRTRGLSAQMHYENPLFGFDNQFSGGLAIQLGDSHFDSVLELSGLDPITRSTKGLGTGTFFDDAATDINTSTDTYSVYFTNTTEISTSLALTVSARYNLSDTTLRDQSGVRPELNGDHRFTRLNPAIGLTWNPTEQLTVYGSYSEANRIPTPIELACNEGVFELAQSFALARGDDPEDVEFECRLPNAFLADPPLNDVVTKSIELGLRGTIAQSQYQISVFRARNHDDILFQTTGRSTGLFANVDETRRQGIELSVDKRIGKLSTYASVSLLEATFQDHFFALSPNHPFANSEGEIEVSPGDRLPGLPEKIIKIGGDYLVNENLSLGIEFIYNGSQYLRGDENNQLSQIDAASLVNLRAQYTLSKQLSFFARVSNAFDKEYENFGLIGEDPSEVIPSLTNTNPVFLGVGSPRAAWIGAKFQL